MTGQSQKSKSGTISPVRGDAFTVPTETKICLVGKLPDVITYAKFQDDIFMRYYHRGSNFPFSYSFLHGPYNSAACDYSYQVITATIVDIFSTRSDAGLLVLSTKLLASHSCNQLTN